MTNWNSYRIVLLLLQLTAHVSALSAIAPYQGQNKVLVLVEPSPLTYGMFYQWDLGVLTASARYGALTDFFYVILHQ